MLMVYSTADAETTVLWARMERVAQSILVSRGDRQGEQSREERTQKQDKNALDTYRNTIGIDQLAFSFMCIPCQSSKCCISGKRTEGSESVTFLFRLDFKIPLWCK